jgi:hypothetical protein
MQIALTGILGDILRIIVKHLTYAINTRGLRERLPEILPNVLHSVNSQSVNVIVSDEVLDP